jgi:tripartite-type tricarboxylate transporter receptor subunit TctC
MLVILILQFIEKCSSMHEGSERRQIPFCRSRQRVRLPTRYDAKVRHDYERAGLMQSRLAQPLLLCCALAAATAAAQSYPSRPVRLIVPFAPGGGTDIMARALAARLTETWRQQVVVDNRGGGATIIGTELAAKAAPDGHTLLVATTTFAINPSYQQRLPYDTLRDFQPISQIAFQPYLLAVNNRVPARDVKEFIALLKARPGGYNFGSPGTASGTHLASELFRMMTGTQAVHVPYKGTAPAIADVIAGQIQFIFGTILATVPHVKSGRLRGIGVSSEKRAASLPDVATIAEAGVPGYSAASWAAVYAPAGVPRAVASRLNTDVVQAIRSADVRDKLAADGAEPVGSSAIELAAFMRIEIAKWAKVVSSANLRAP